MSSLNRIKKRAKNLQEEKATGVKTSSSLSNIVANAESKRAGTFTYDDIAPVKTTSKKVSTSSSNSSLLKRREELQSLINNYDRKEKREWWDSDDNVLENVGNVFYKLFAEKQDSKYVKDDKFDALVKEYDDITEQIQNNSVENREYSDDLTGFVDKSADVILGNFTTGTKGISTTAKKILGQELTEEDYGLSYAEKLGQKASSSAANSIEKAILDVEGGIARMIPQMATGDPMVSTIVGFANYGGGAYNEARQDGYTDEQATKYGITIGSLEMAMTKALGSFGKIYGSSKLGKISQSVIDKFIPKIISNKQVRQVLSQFGSEGIEEFLQEYTGKIVKDTLLDEKGLSNSTWENITDTDLLADALYSGFIGGITGAALDVPNAIARNNYEKTTGRNVDTAYTQNEQTVIDSLVEEQSTEIAKQQAIENEINKAISSKETEQGGSLSAKEKTALTEAIKSKIETGEIDVSNNKLTNKEISKIRQEIEEKLQKGQLDTTKIDSILGDTLTEQDALLSRSYEEQAKKGQNFTYDNTKVTNEQEKAVYESAAKYFNDTTRSHEFVEKVAKISKDKGTNYGFINNEELSSLGHDVEGKQVNGLVRTNKDGKQTVLINIDSPRALNTIVGHETTHLLEGTQEYTDLQEAIFNYAKEKGDFDSRQKALNELYEGIENANIDSELTADLVGEYLFTDERFIDSLSTQKPTLFQKIKELIDDLVVRFKGTKEEKALREVQKKFKEAYKNQNNNIGNEIKYMMTSTKGMENGLAINTRYQDIKNRYEKALQLETNENYTNEDIRQETGWFKDNQGNWEFEISDQYTKMKIQPKENSKYKLSEIFDANTLYEMYPELKDMPVEFKDIKSNGSYNSETKKITINNTLINNLDNLRGTLLHEIQHYIQHTEGLPTGTNILFGNEQYANSKGEIEAADTKRRRNLTVEQRKSIIPESAKDNPVHPNREAILNRKRNTVEKIAEKLYNIFGDEASEIFEENIEKTDNENIELDGKLGNNQQVYRGFNNRIKELEDSSFSYDNQGRTLTKEQQEYFKDSKVRDENGNLLTVYHGTKNGGFTEFSHKDPSIGNYRFGDKNVNFFTSDRTMAISYGDADVSEAKKINTPKLSSIEEVNEVIDEQNKLLYEMNKEFDESYDKDKRLTLKEENGKIFLYDETKLRHIFNNENDLIRNINSVLSENYGKDYKESYYEGYVNITNPYVVDAKGKNWKHIETGISQETVDIYNSITDEQKEVLKKVVDNQYQINFSQVLRDSFNYGETGGKFFNGQYLTNKEINELANVYSLIKVYGEETQKLSVSLDALYKIVESNFDENTIKEYSKKKQTTNDIVKEALNDGSYDGVIIKNVIDYGSEVGTEKPSDLYITIESSNQFKNIDNTNPTSDADIRYSLSEDTQGRKLSANQKEYFKDVSNELKDENGNLKVLYHGSNSEFTIFDLNKGGASNSKAGVGFWFTESGIGAKNFAESVWYGDRTPTTYEVYLNLKNPKVYEPVDTKAQKQELNKKLKELYNKKRNIEDEYAWETPSLTIVAEYLKDYKESDVANNLIKNCGYREAQAKKYIEAAEEYNKLVKEYKSIEKEHDNLGYDDSYEQFRTDIYKVAGMSANDANTGGVGMAINNNDEVVKQYRDNLIKEGYDGIVIKNTVYDTQTLGEGNNQYVAFYPEQIKNVTNENPTDNPDINLSLSQQGEQIAPTGDYNVYGEDVKLQIAPLQEEIKILTETVQELKEQIAPVKQTEEFRALTEEDLPMLEQQYNEAPMNDIAPPEIEQTIDYMPDAISMDNKTLKTLTRNIKNELGLNRIQTTELEKVVQEFTTNETATREDLFNAISERFSEQTLEHKNEEIIAIKNFLRNYPIKVSNYLKTEFKEGFNKVRQSNFNKLKFTNDGTEVDAAYQELSSMFPSLFTDDIANAQDQLSKIIEVANLDVMSTEEFVLPEDMVRETSNFIYDSIQDYKLDEAFKAAEQVRRLPIDENMIPVEIVENSMENKDIAPVKAQATESVEENKNLTIKDSNALKLKNLESTLEKYRVDAENSFNSFKELIREKNNEYDSLANKNTLKANNLLQQVRRLVAQRDNIQVEYERKMNNIQKRIDRMNSKEFKTAEQRMSKQEEYREQARALIGDTSFWKDKKLGIQYQINTFKRNLRDIVKGADGKADIQTADAIYEEYQGNYNRNEAKLKVESNKIKQPYMDMKLTKQEDAYVQMLGELKYNPDTTLRQDVVEGYYELNKKHIDINKVNKAIEMARKTYDSLYERINEVLRNQGMKELGYRQGYFPHFTEEKQSMLAKLFDWKVKNNEIPTDIARLTELNNPERSWQSFNKQRKGDTTDYSFSKGLDTYVHGALDWIYHIEDIQKRRALENEIRYQHSEKGVQEKIEAIYNNPELDADEVQTQIEAIYGVAKNPLNNFVTDLRNSTNNLTGKKSSADRGLEYATNRQIYSIMTNISSRVSGNMVGGSISSALTNFIPITQSWGEVSPLSSLNAIRETIKSSIKDDGTIVKSTFLTNRLVKEEKLSKTNWDKASDVVGVMTEVIDNITSQTVWRSKYNENIKKGMSEFNAIKNADQFAENVIAGRSRGNQPTIFNSKNPITKMLTAFQLEVANQYGYMLKDMPTDISEKSKRKLIKGYASMFMGAYLYNALYSSLTGRDSAFDPIGIVEDILKEFGFGDDDEEEKSASEKLTSITEDLVQEIPFIGGLFGGGRLPISSAIPYENPFEMATGTMTDVLDAFDEEKKEKALKDLTSEWLKPVTYLALPFGGGQISKSIKGLSMYDEDLPIAGSYTNGGDLRFTADESLGGKLKSFLFGQYASKSAQEYVDSGFKTIKKSNIEELMDLGMTSTEYRKYRQELKNAGNTNKSKLDYINGLDAPISHKNIMANNVLDRDYKVDMRDYTTYDEFDFSYKNPEKYEWLQKNNISYSDYIANDESKEAYNWAYSNPESYLVSRTVTDDVVAYRQYKSEIGNLKADYNSNGKQIKDSRRNKVIDYVNSLNLSVPQRAILIRQEYLTFNDYNNEIVEYVRNLNISYDEKVSILEELDMTVKDGRVYWK